MHRLLTMIRAASFIFSIFLTSLSHAQRPPSNPIDTTLAAACFAQVEKLSQVDGGKLWGVPLYGPFFFVDPASQSVVANQADKEGRLTRNGAVWIGRLPDNLAPANTSINWAGVHWTMVMWPVPELEHARGRLLLHECFHRIQDGLGLPGSNPNNSHLDDAQGRIWMRLEMRALAEALTHAGKERLAAIGDALAFRAQRQKLSGAKQANNERDLEMNEGLAEYTGLVLSGYGKPSLETRATVRLEQEQANTTFARSFAYAIGPAYGLLLDSYRVPWRKGLKPSVSLPAMLAKAARASNVGDPVGRASRYGGPQVFAFETAQAERRAAKIAGFRTTFVDGRILSLPVASQFSFSFDPNGVDSFPGVGQIFESARISDDWGVLQVSSGGVLMKRPEAKFTGVVVRAPINPAGNTITGEGWTLSLNSGWKVTPGARSGDWVVVHK